jgi:integrase
MARHVRNSKLETRATRLDNKLHPVRLKPYWQKVAPGISLGYRRNQSAGTWVVRGLKEDGRYWEQGVGTADDYQDADGETVLTFWEAQDNALTRARGAGAAPNPDSPTTLGEALDDYERDLIVRNAEPANARRLRRLLPSALLAKPVALLTMKDLRRFRDGLLDRMTTASVNRTCKPLKAALTLAWKSDKRRIANRDAWLDALEVLPEEPHDRNNPNNVVWTPAQIRDLIAAAYEIDDKLGLLVDVLAGTGVRLSQAARLRVGDIRSDDLLDMPRSKKGKKQKTVGRKLVPIDGTLAAKLREAAAGRGRADPLLLRSDGLPWAKANHRTLFLAAMTKAGIPKSMRRVTQPLRHSSITHMEARGIGRGVVADLHDTSIRMIDQTYGSNISKHVQDLVRAARVSAHTGPGGR